MKKIFDKFARSLMGLTAGVGLGVVAALVVAACTPSMAPLIDAPITDDAMRTAIIARIKQEGVKTSVKGGIVMVKDEATAEKMRAIIIREGLVPSGTSPWAIFDLERWTLTDFERNVKLQQAIQEKIRNHIKALDEVDNAEVALVVPARTLFTADQNPVTASIIITPRPGSDITVNRHKIEGIQKIALFAVEGLTADNITIADNNGVVLNDFKDVFDFERLSIIEKGEKIRRSQEMLYHAAILAQLQSKFGADRVRDLAISLSVDMSKEETEKTEVTPITMKAQTPDLAYDDSRLVQIDGRTVSVNIDGVWHNPKDEKGRIIKDKSGAPVRECTPLMPEQIRDVTALIQGAIGYSAERGDSVAVTKTAFDRSAQFAEEDAALARIRQTLLLIVMAGPLLLCAAFVTVKASSASLKNVR